MASSPNSGSGSPLSLPRQRPYLAKGRTLSVASNASSAHPLRQTSFPPPDSLEVQRAFSEDAASVRSPSQGALGDVSDSEIMSELNGTVDGGGGGEEEVGGTRKRKRGEKRERGRPPKGSGASSRMGSVSLVNGEDGGGKHGAPSVVTGNGDVDDEDDDLEDDEVAAGGRVPMYEGGQMSAAELSTDNLNKAMLREYMGFVDRLPYSHLPGVAERDHGERFDTWQRTKLRTADLRRLINQTLSQSVPPTVVTVVSSYTKLFAGMIIEAAREVQAEWDSVEEKRADGEDNPVYKRLKRSQRRNDEQDGDGNDPTHEVKADLDFSPFHFSSSFNSNTSTPIDAPRPGSRAKSTELLNNGVPADASGPPVGTSTADQQKSFSNGTQEDASHPPSSSGTLDSSLPVVNGTQEDSTQPSSVDANRNSPRRQLNGTQDGSPRPYLNGTREGSPRTYQNGAHGLPSPSSPAGDTGAGLKEAMAEFGDLGAPEPRTDTLASGGAGGLSTSLAECDRGPLLPDHLREAIRRYRKSREGGTVGFTGFSSVGREVAAVKTGGRRLFR